MDLLLKAAEFLDNHGRSSSDHIYAATITKHLKTKPANRSYVTKLTPSRRVHNELEKSRRAKLKNSLESLKSIIPNLETSTKFTQIKLLHAATDYIQFLKEENKTCLGHIKNLAAEQSHLEDKLKSLTFVYRVRSSSLSSFESTEDGSTGSREGSESDCDSFIEVS